MSENRIRTVIFDIGGVLVGYDWDKSFMEFFDGNRPMVDRLKDALFGHGIWDEVDRGVWSDTELLAAFTKYAPDLEKEIHYIWDHMDLIIYPYEFTANWIRNLRSRGYKVYYLSNWSYHLRDIGHETLRFLSLTDGGLYSCDAKLLKPDPKIYRALAEKYDLIPSECIFLDDREANVNGAIDCGFRGIVVRNHEQAAADLEAALEKEGCRI